MLRYVFYDCSKDKVKLREEIDYIENFITFQQMKSEFEQHITLDFQEADPDTVIAPMLFTPFIENAFKFSKIEEDPNAFVHIVFKTNNGVLRFLIENSLPPSGKPQAGQGLGIPNVKQRLKVLYPRRHELNIDEKNQKFTVRLKIHSQ